MKDSFLEILRGVLETRGEAGRVLHSKALTNELSRAERTMICHFLTDELMTSGLEANDEPNARGLLIESVVNPPNIKEKIQWIRPKLVCEVEYAELTADEQLRQTTFLGWRDDKKAKEVVLEQSQAA
jgi:ATP-dependent DNA ligase